jgi:hypothetical protein
VAGPFGYINEPFDSVKCWEFQAELLLASEEGLCYMEVVYKVVKMGVRNGFSQKRV